ncbi:MAG: hypothetical protein ACLFT6_08105 [Bacteroidales bacterium]
MNERTLIFAFALDEENKLLSHVNLFFDEIDNQPNQYKLFKI